MLAATKPNRVPAQFCYKHDAVPKIIVEQNLAGPQKSIDAPEGGSLMDIADEQWLPIPFSCRSASCATCHVEVLEGADLLDQPGADERDLLDVVGGPAGSRLACQLRISPGPGLVRIRPV
jgi:ferredoxin